MLKLFTKYLSGRKSKFKPGDAVQLLAGGELMVVTGVHLNSSLPEPLVECRWFDRMYLSNRRNFFREASLVNFDWYHAQ